MLEMHQGYDCHLMQTRQYQLEALDGIIAQLNDNASTLLVMATGTGKTFVFSHVAKEFMRWGRVMVLAHRGELIYQAVNQLTKIAGCEPDIEMADYHATRGRNQSRIICSTIQSQIAGMNGEGRMTKFRPEDFSLLITDEAHHAAANSYKKVIAYYQQNKTLKHLGVTATPDRADELALGQIFETVAFEYGILEAVKDGYLVPIQQQAVYVEDLDFSGMRTTAGDLNGKDLAAVMETEAMLHEIAAPTIELTTNKKTLVFAASLMHAERLTEILNRHRADSAKWVHGGTPKDERAIMFREYGERRFQYLVNVGVATEGFDDPGIEVVVMAKPTKSRSLYAQCLDTETQVLTKWGWRDYGIIKKYSWTTIEWQWECEYCGWTEKMPRGCGGLNVLCPCCTGLCVKKDKYRGTKRLGSGGPKVATMNIKTGRIEWQRPFDYVLRELATKEWFIESNHDDVNIRVTNGHRLIMDQSHIGVYDDASVGVISNWIACSASFAEGREITIPVLENGQIRRRQVAFKRGQKRWESEGVWCLSVPNGALITRRKGGRPAIVGNCIGRGTRTLPGTIDGIQDTTARRSAIELSFKPALDVLDFVGNTGRHRLITTADILGGDYNDDVVDRAKKNIEKSDKTCSVMDELENAQKELEREAISSDAALRRARIIARAKFSTAKVNPFNVLDLEPVREKGWNTGKEPSEAQKACLEKMGVDTAGLSATHSSQLIGTLFKNRNDGICTYKQSKVLSKFGYDPKEITFAKAGELIDAIANNGWRRPK